MNGRMAAFKSVFNSKSVNELAALLEREKVIGNRQRFVEAIVPRLSKLELKGRVSLIAQVLANQASSPFPIASERLIRTLAEANEGEWTSSKTQKSTGLSGFMVWPLTEYVANEGLPHFDASMQALKELTKRFTSEFAIRPFLIQHRDRTLNVLKKWASDEDEHVRRLCSEGTRPRLPWGIQLKEFIDRPQFTQPILSQLWNDNAEYVRRSVANHVNDISKDHPEVAIRLIDQWQAKTPESRSRETLALARRALRTLVKAGHSDSLALLGFHAVTRVKLARFKLEGSHLRMPGTLIARFAIVNDSGANQRLMIDYAIHHMRASGATTPKVFKFRAFEIEKGQTTEFVLKHPFRKITTRRYYSGRHAIEIFANGSSLGKKTFDLEVD